MYLNEQEYFIALAEEKNFTRAAEQACISQPALSKAIAKLERDYGCQLVKREGKEISLTAAGKLYLESAHKMMEIREKGYEKMRAAARKAERHLRVGINRQYSQRYFSDAMQKIYSDYPGALPDVYEIDSRQALDMLREGLLDVIVAMEREDQLPEDLVRYPLTQEYLGVYMPDTPEFQPIFEQYPCGADLPVEQLNGKTALRTAPGSDLDETLQEYFRRNHVNPNYVCMIFEVSTAIDAVKNGMGMAFHHLSRASQFHCSHYYHVVPDPCLRHYIFLRPDTSLTPQIQFLIDMLLKNRQE